MLPNREVSVVAFAEELKMRWSESGAAAGLTRVEVLSIVKRLWRILIVYRLASAHMSVFFAQQC